MAGPLTGIKVVDLSAVVSGPLAAMVLADQGADVIKVEPLAGEVLRVGPFSRAGMTASFAHCNRNKRGIAIDVTQPEGLKVIHQMVAESDVLIQNWRPGVANKLGLGEIEMRDLNPELIYCSISGYGPSGPYSNRRIYDPIIQGFTGTPAIQKHPEFPIPDLVRQVMVDKSTSHMAAQAISSALFARERGAGGQHIEIPMIDAALAFFWPDGMTAHTFTDGVDIAGVPGYEAYRLWSTKDGQIVYFVATQTEYESLFRALGHPEWINDPRFGTIEARHNLQHREQLGELIDEAIRSKTTEELLQQLVDHDVPAGPVLELEEIFEDPQIKHNKAILELEHPKVGRYRQARPAARFSNTPQDAERCFPPMLGEHTQQVLGELGYSEAQVEQLLSKGIISAQTSSSDISH